jgi:hypothetical protein
MNSAIQENASAIEEIKNSAGEWVDGFKVSESEYGAQYIVSASEKGVYEYFLYVYQSNDKSDTVENYSFIGNHYSNIIIVDPSIYPYNNKRLKNVGIEEDFFSLDIETDKFGSTLVLFAKRQKDGTIPDNVVFKIRKIREI